MSSSILTVNSDLSHSWAVDLKEAAAIQERLAASVTLRPMASTGQGRPILAAGVDVAYSKDGRRAWAVAVVTDSRFRIRSIGKAEGAPDCSYTPGYLAFREGRLTVAALLALKVTPDIVFLDGHGVVHERGLGLASHVGVLLDVPTIGVPKTPFHSIDHHPGSDRGEYYVLSKDWGAEGASIRLKARANPVYVSPGHLMDLQSAIALSMTWSSGRHRVPEPLSFAHTASVEARNVAMAG